MTKLVPDGRRTIEAKIEDEFISLASGPENECFALHDSKVLEPGGTKLLIVCVDLLRSNVYLPCPITPVGCTTGPVDQPCERRPPDVTRTSSLCRVSADADAS